jgi:hypothetical protein
MGWRFSGELLRRSSLAKLCFCRSSLLASHPENPSAALCILALQATLVFALVRPRHLARFKIDVVHGQAEALGAELQIVGAVFLVFDDVIRTRCVHVDI